MVGVPTRSQVERWRTDHLDAAAKTWGDQANLIDVVFGTALRYIEQVPWDGKTGDAAAKKAYEDLQKVGESMKKLRAGEQMARNSAQQLKDAKAKAVVAINAAEGEDYDVNEPLTVVDNSGLKVAFGGMREIRRQSHESTIRTEALGLAAIDEQIALALNPIAQELRAFTLNDPGDDGSMKGEPGASNTAAYEDALRNAGLLQGEPTGYYKKWLENAARQGVSPETIVDIARRHKITPESFKVLEGMEEIKDPDGKSFFLLPVGVSGDDARKATLMTYILNCGTDYGKGGEKTDFEPTPYSANEVQRIIDRQAKNSWTYDDEVAGMTYGGGRVVTAPNGMLMALGGGWQQDAFTQGGGTTYGDMFKVNIDHSSDPSEQLRRIIRGGVMWYGNDGNPHPGQLDLDRILHHEERHSQQWAANGRASMVAQQAWELANGRDQETNKFEKDAGLSDGGYP
ncbi:MULTISPECIES: hypothetical protein [unclassified Mycobacteroides]|uniref:hypothetical protein n=1 Tax=unclassified Mycobacteroides TaxID=2618759 RepID=UPI001EF0559C|nr:MULTISPECIES: hypothetical protein [unclassified Mycobacteroides]